MFFIYFNKTDLIKNKKFLFHDVFILKTEEIWIILKIFSISLNAIFL